MSYKKNGELTSLLENVRNAYAQGAAVFLTVKDNLPETTKLEKFFNRRGFLVVVKPGWHEGKQYYKIQIYERKKTIVQPHVN